MSCRRVSISVLVPVVGALVSLVAGCSDPKPIAAPQAGSDSCYQAPLLTLVDGAAAARGTIPGGDEGTRAACGLPSGSDAFVRVRLEQESQLTFIVAADAPAVAVLLPDGCDTSSALAGCVESDSATLAPGSYVLAVVGQPGTSFTLSVAAGAPAPSPDDVMPSPSCETPPTLSLLDGAVSVTGELPAGATGGSLCSASSSGDAFYRIHLTQPADLGVVVSSEADVRASVLPETCPAGGSTAACAAVSTTAVEPGSYLVAVSGPSGAAFALTIVAVPHAYSVGSDSCDAPPALSLATGSARVTGSVPTGDDGLARACGAAAGSDVFFRVRAAVETDLSFIVSGGAGVHAAILDDTCPIGTPIAACATADLVHVAAGTYLVGVYGPAGAAYDLTVAVADVEQPPPPPGSCSSPLTVPLASGTNVLSGTFDSTIDNGTGSCMYSTTPDLVYELTLSETADVVVQSNGAFFLRAATCAAGPQLGCSSYGGSVQLVDLAPGTYYLFVEKPPYSSTYSVSVSLLPPTPRPANDNCTGAIQLALAAGAASATGSFLATVPETSSTCGGKRALYYSFSLATASAVQLKVDNSYVAIELLTGACSSSSALLCDGSNSTRCTDVLPAGDYLVRLSEDYGTVVTPVTLTVRTLAATTAPPNDTCEYAALLTLAGTSASVSGTVAGADQSLTLSGPNCSTSSGAGQDVFYRVSLPEKSDVTARLTGSQDLQVGLVTGGCISPATLGCSWYSSVQLYGVPAGDILVVVERRYAPYTYNGCPSTTDGFTVDLQVTPSPAAPVNDSCDAAIPLAVSTVGTATSVTGTTRGATNDIGSVLCPGNTSATSVSGPDVVYSLTLTEPGRIRVTPTSTFSGMTMYLLGGGCPLTAAMACSGYYSSALDTGFALMPGTYYLVVDATSYGSQASPPGDFSLVVDHVAQ